MKLFPARTSPLFHGWKVVGVCFLIAVYGWGLGFYGVGVYLAALSDAHGWSSFLVSSAVTIYYVLGACCVLFLSGVLGRFGPQRVILAGSLALGVGVLSLTLVNTPLEMFGAFLVMSAGWGAMSGASINAILAPWFEKKRGMAVSLALTGASAGGVVVVPLLLWLTSQYGFATGLRVTVGLLWLILVPFVILWLVEKPEALGLAVDGAPHEESGDGPSPQPVPPWRRAQALRNRLYWTVQVPFALGLAAQVGFLTHQVAYLTPLLGTAGTGLAVGLTTTGAIVGRLAVGAVVHRLGYRRAAAGCLGLQAAATATLMLGESPGILYVACLAFGIGGGNLISLPALIVHDEFPATAFTKVISMVVAGNQFTFAFGPILLGSLRDMSHGYTVPLALVLILEVIAAAIVLIRPRHTAERRFERQPNATEGATRTS